MKRDEVVRILHEQQKELVERYHIVSLSLFGSLVRENARPNCKVNILVKFAQPTALFQLIDLKKRLEALLGCKVGLGKPSWLKPQVKTGILQEALRVF